MNTQLSNPQNLKTAFAEKNDKHTFKCTCKAVAPGHPEAEVRLERFTQGSLACDVVFAMTCKKSHAQKVRRQIVAIFGC